MSRLLKTILILLVLAGLGYRGWQRYAAAGHDPHAAMGMGGAAPVGVAAVLVRDVRLWNEFSGRLTAVESAVVRPRVTGTIEEVHFKDGALVHKGQVLFTIDRRSYRAEVERAEGNLAAATAQALAAKRELERADHLFEEKALSQRDYDQRKSGSDVAAASVKVAASALDTAKLNLDYTEVQAPISGRIGRAEVTQGNLVEAGMGAAPVLTTIVSDNPIYADFDMDEPTFLHYIGAAAGNVSKIPVELGLAGETGTPHSGHISSFDNQLSTTSGTIRVRAVFDNPDGLLVPGLFAHLLVGSPAERKVTLINDRAVGTDQNKKFVLVVGEENKVEYREIHPGPLTDGLRIVEEGLKEGEKIVVSGLQRARPGAPVTPEMVSMATLEAPAQAEEGQK